MTEPCGAYAYTSDGSTLYRRCETIEEARQWLAAIFSGFPRPVLSGEISATVEAH